MTPERWRRVNSLFESAMRRGEAERAAWLAEETRGDSGLRREVENMLRHASGVGLLDSPAWEGLRAESPLPPGARLGPYEIVDQIGAGGMGRVYKACDTRIGRTVAIKVLNAEFSDRLRVEAQAISALSHPHVCALYDIGDQDGAAYLVMEYLEGESLSAHIKRGPLPLDRALRYGAEIASALAAAHAQGIVHRDLKPANIMITASGAKVLDFGVARTPHEEESLAGALVGTAAYMSPSQLNGNPADARSDIFALGLVLHEMVAGGRRSADLPRPLALLIERCLREDARNRVQRMEDVQSALERARLEIGRPAASPWPKRILVATLATVAAAPFLVWKAPRQLPRAVNNAPSHALLLPSPANPPTPVVKSPEPPVKPKPAPTPVPPVLVQLTGYTGLQRDPSISPDTAKLAFSWERGPGYQIWIRPIAEGASPIQLTSGTAEDWGPAWSRDGHRIAFRRRSRAWGIYWIDAVGGAPNLVASIAPQNQLTLPQMSWSANGEWIAAPDRDSSGATRLYLFSVSTGERRPLTDNSIGTAHAPAFSPDGRSLAYALCAPAVFPCDVYVADLKRDLSPARTRRITHQDLYIRGIAWAADGRSIVYSASLYESDGGTYLYRVPLHSPGAPRRIDLAGVGMRHPAIAGGLLAVTKLPDWHLFVIENFR